MNFASIFYYTYDDVDVVEWEYEMMEAQNTEGGKKSSHISTLLTLMERFIESSSDWIRVKERHFSLGKLIVLIFLSAPLNYSNLKWAFKVEYDKVGSMSYKIQQINGTWGFRGTSTIRVYKSQISIFSFPNRQSTFWWKFDCTYAVIIVYWIVMMTSTVSRLNINKKVFDNEQIINNDNIRWIVDGRHLTFIEKKKFLSIFISGTF